MSKIYQIIFISYVCFIINSCAEIDRSSRSINSFLTEQIWSPTYNLLIKDRPIPFANKLDTEQNSFDIGDNPYRRQKYIFLVKQNSSGSREWIMDLELSDKESGITMAFDSSDNVYITRFTRNVHEDINNSGDFTVFLIKYNSTGSREWIEKLGKSAGENGIRLIVDSHDNIYVAGYYDEFDSDNDFESQKTVLAKYDSSGTREWTTALVSTLTDFTWDVTADSFDNIYVTGFLENDFAQNIRWEEDILMMKFNSEGIKL